MIQGEAHVASDCQAIQEILTEHGGGLDRLDEVQSRHLEVCPECREVAAAERALGLLFARAIPPADPGVEEYVLAALRPARIRRRIVAFLPVAASLLVALLGAVMVGGVPSVCCPSGRHRVGWHLLPAFPTGALRSPPAPGPRQPRSIPPSLPVPDW